jgi:hypothetical protein
VLIDRISQEVKHYRFYLKAAALGGAFVINDPLWWSADDKFFGYSLVSRIGIATPRTVMLPQKDYIPAIDKSRSLRNLEFPRGSGRRLRGFPAVLKPADGGGGRGIVAPRAHAPATPRPQRDDTQEFIDFEVRRCICISRDRSGHQYSPARRCVTTTGEVAEGLRSHRHDSRRSTSRSAAA